MFIMAITACQSNVLSSDVCLTERIAKAYRQTNDHLPRVKTSCRRCPSYDRQADTDGYDVRMSWNFASELARFGPGMLDRPVPLGRARAYCAWVTRSHYENFTVASWLLPRRLLPHFQAIYAYCRWSDDLADETVGGAESLALLEWWRSELAGAFEGQPRHPVMVALAATIHRFRFSPQPFLDLLSAFEQDQYIHDYQSFAELLEYCRRSANPVGRMVLRLFEVDTPDRVELSDAICTGLQLANFWQDVAQDWVRGRIYLPREDRQRFHYSDGDFAARRYTPAFRELLRFEVARTRDYFARGRPLLDLMPREARIDVELFLSGGSAVLDAIEANNYDVWSHRPIVSRWQKLKLFGQAMLSLR
jgi:squalene synthase HpnC